MTNLKNKWLRRKIDDLQSRASCCNCGSHEIEFAHLEETEVNSVGRGRWKRYYDWIKNPDKYTPLCKECHQKYDRGEILKNVPKSLIELGLVKK